MKPASAERWAWLLLYGGLLVLCLGVFVRRADPGLGVVLIVGGVVATIVGIGLVAVRSRMPP